MRRSGETGAALLTVLLLVAVIAALAAVSLERIKIATRLATNMAVADQSRAFGFAGETIAALRIADLNEGDRPGSDWVDRETQFPIDGGIATAKLSDGGNCFNLNSLGEGDAESGLSARPAGMLQFEALMEALDVRSNQARGIAAAAADWIDSDTEPLPGGGEDSVYAKYRTANTTMADPSELRTVAGVTPQIYARLRPFLCALPVSDLSPININNLRPDQAVLIAMLLPRAITIAQAKQIIDERPKAGYSDIVEFWKTPALAGHTPPADVLAQPQLKTRWFTAEFNITLGGAELREIALIDGALKPARVVRRAYGDPS